MFVPDKEPQDCVEFPLLQRDHTKLKLSKPDLQTVGEFVDNACYFRCGKNMRDKCWATINTQK